ncbi:uncharacterized protein PFL1_00439 [Pseudozyma flocculosa PF-1]|uniref:DNA repair protein REV1 n=1 Tax=Pseudozyma flocculosa TaxID=84751 RepID=A0A5C3ERF7_9BASI|nr:uncharacterized protein PFL1_00439 [Pseudozyma flocculosa PF-1]EPQ32242.1 hypothetical protein PFL1_00439 [Pseudozyma flocculosa PF-1]SPO34808.1 related to DNA repair protein MUS-42 [Pseudozyma flocculosa]
MATPPPPRHQSTVAAQPSDAGPDHSEDRDGWTDGSEDDQALLEALAKIENQEDDAVTTPDEDENDDDGIYTPPLPSQQSIMRLAKQAGPGLALGGRIITATPPSSPPPMRPTEEKKSRRKVQWADEDVVIEPAAPANAGTAGDGGWQDPIDYPRQPHGTDEGQGNLRLGANAHADADDGLDEEAPQAGQPDGGASTDNKKAYLESEIYNPIAYGDMRSYMKYKRAKLKVQEAALLQEEAELMQAGDAAQAALNGNVQEAPADGKKSDIFKGCCVYINGQTHPPYSELRRLLVLHGGQHMPYLDQKRPCTHIVASNLTPKKRIEFKDYKVVLPGWILESIETGKRADWRKWKCDAITGSNGHVGGNLVGNEELGLAGWRDLAKQAQSGKALPRFGEAVESPWGRPGAQKTLLQGFMKPKEAKESPSPVVQVETPAQQHQRRDTSTRLPSSLSTSAKEQISRIDNGRGNGPAAEPKVGVVPAQRKPELTKEASPALASAVKPLQHLAQELESDSAQDAAAAVQPPKPLGTTDEATGPTSAPQTPTRGQAPGRNDYSIGTDPRTRAADVAARAGDITMKSGYASRPSNTHAARLLASPSWRERNTATSEGFLAGYFAKSRLHHLSTWKTSLQDMVSSALREAGRPAGSLDLPKGVERVIMHIDFDSFFVSVGLRKRPDLKDKPVVVCHGSGAGLPPAAEGSEKRPADDQSSSTSEIASCNYVARKFGVRNGMSLGQAKKLCPQVQTIPYDFKAYNDISLAFYAFLLEHADALQAVSVDEALVDVSMLLENMRNGFFPAGSLYQRYSDRVSSQGDKEKWSAEKQLAEAFRDEIRDLCGCEASIGIGSNILLARLATRKAKPGGSFHLTEDLRQSFLDGLDVDDLHGIGWSLRNRLRELFETINVGEIRIATTERRLVHELGPKKGKVVWDKLHGRDADRLEGNKLRQSVGSHVNYGIRFLTNDEAETFVDGMCQEVSQRARAVRLRGRQVSVQVMVRAKDAPHEAPKFLGHGVCDTHHRSTQVSGPGGCAIDDKERIKQAAWPLIRDLRADPKELRGIAISLNKLELSDGSGSAAAPGPQKGQSVLRFDKVSPAKKPAAPAASSAGKSAAPRWPATPSTAAQKLKERLAQYTNEASPSTAQEDEEMGNELPDLQKGPLAATPRRPVAAKHAQAANERDPDRIDELGPGFQTPPPQLPAATQLAIPSASQLDPTVIAALPTPFREQIYAALGRTGGGKEGGSLQPTPDRASQNTPRVLPRSTPTTPQKAKVAPSPAMAEALLLPSMSQIDASVLAELPESIRRDILRQSRLGEPSASTSRSSSPSISTPTKRKKALADSTLPFLPLGGGGDLDAESAAASKKRKTGLFRSLSESPRKRVKTKLCDSLVAGQTELDANLLDPASISTNELKALGIDSDVFRALPADMQREMYVYHRDRRASELKRFKAGSNRSGWEEMTYAERRRRETRRAAELEAEAFARQQQQRQKQGHPDKASLKTFFAVPLSRRPAAEAMLLEAATGDQQRQEDAPNLRGATEVESIRPLLTAWFDAFAQYGPREGDVHRIASFLEACLDPSAPIGSRRWDVDKVEACLVSLRGVIALRLGEDAETRRSARSWVKQQRRRRQRQRQREGAETKAGVADKDGDQLLDGSAAARWWVAFYDILERVNERVKARMDGAVLSLD